MNTKTIGVLLIILVMFISIGAISAADTNETLMEEVSDTDIATTSVVEQDNAISPESESGGDVEINVTDSRDEISTNEVKVTSKSTEVLSASNDDVLKSSRPFHFNGNTYEHLDDTIAAAIEAGGGTIYVEDGTYYTDPEDDCNFEISGGKSITITAYNPGGVTFESDDNDYFRIR